MLRTAKNIVRMAVSEANTESYAYRKRNGVIKVFTFMRGSAFH